MLLVSYGFIVHVVMFPFVSYRELENSYKTPGSCLLCIEEFSVFFCFLSLLS